MSVENKSNILNSIFDILKSKNIYIDKEPFTFRLNSHPNYPSLLSIVDTLDYYNINHSVYQVNFEEIEDTPKEYLAFLKGQYGVQDLHYIKKKNENYLIDNRKTSLSVLQNRWTEFVLLIEGSKVENVKEPFLSFMKTAIIILILLILTNIYSLNKSLYSVLFFALPVLGFVLSLSPLKEILKINHGFLKKICKTSSRTDCKAITESKKFRLTRYINFSDLSIIFFASQLLAYLIMNISNLQVEYFTIQKIALLSSLPFVLISMFVQKFVERKWCVVCLSIIILLLAEYLYISFLFWDVYFFNHTSILLYIVILAITIISWYYLKQLFSSRNESVKNEIRLTRFLRDYSKFKKELIKNGRFQLPENIIELNKNKISITLVTDPFCDQCKEAHKVLKEIIAKNSEILDINFLFKVDINSEKDEHKLLYRNLAKIQLSKAPLQLSTSLSYWFKHENTLKWLEKYSGNINEIQIDELLLQQNEWCLKNNFDYTPFLFVNEYLYPLEYDIKDLEYFIQDLVNDAEL